MNTAAVKSNVQERFGNDALYSQIHEDALMLMESIGFGASEKTAAKIFEAVDPSEAGNLTYVESVGRIYPSREAIESSLDRVRQGMDFWPHGFGTGGMAAYIVDENGPRPSDLDDMKRLAKFYGKTEELTSLQSSFNLCNRIKKADTQKRIEIECAGIDIMVENAGGKLVTPTLRTDEAIAHLAGYHRKGVKVGAALSVTSTFLGVSEEMIDVFLAVVKAGLPYIMNSMPIGGLTGPYSMSALATLAHAESMFGLMLGQMTTPGIKAVHAAMPSISDMSRKDMPLMFGSRSNTMLNILIAETNGYLGLPTMQSACAHSRENYDAEAERQSAETYALIDLYPYHIMRHMFGFSAQINDFSIENLEKQIALYRKSRFEPVSVRMPEPAQYDDEGLEAIIEGIERNDFRQLNHTLKNIGREFNI
jgi:trimethylamine:corrinoid methyltransferase-like protein